MKYDIEVREDNAGYLFLCVQADENKWLVFDGLERCHKGSGDTILTDQVLGDATEVTEQSLLDSYGTCVYSNGEKDVEAMGPAARRFFGIVE